MNVCEGLEDFVEASSAIVSAEGRSGRSTEEGRGCSSGFDELWAQLGRVVRTYPYGAETPSMSFGRLTLRDVLSASTCSFSVDASNLWVCPQWPQVKFTTHTFLGGEEGFIRAATKTAGVQCVFFALEYEGMQPRKYTFETSVCYAIPEIIGPHAFLGWVSMFFGVSEPVTPPPTVSASTGPLASEDIIVDIHKLFVRWKTERPGQKPTIPKLAEFGGVDQEKLKKLINRGPKPWMQLLSDYGFRAAT